ncbi:cytochrome P450 family protein [Mycobacterium xenopi 4042]|uniref:Cytochrome P450 family protein n=1 Tax=Mycobacterium xenopi 4042 TaxID=1299334 RepID=X7YUJ2_MYCXE|nr:cytochrome P450 family protein [Mycobacterium xenopi 4042]EUA84977.1 cytochrome P450 family protein [Mycobacterium xenopi 4042]
MSDAVTVGTHAAAAPPTINLPPAVRIPKTFLGIAFATSRRWTIQQLVPRYGNTFTLTMPIWRHTVVVADPQLAKQVFTTSPNSSAISNPI